MSSTSTTTPPSTEAERTTLGALLIDPDKMIDVAPLLSHEDFHDPIHAAIYKAIQKLYEERRPIDFVTLADTLRENPAIERIGGSAFLASLADNVPTASNTMHYAAIVREKSLKRKLRKMGTAIAQAASVEDQSAGNVLETAERELLQLSRQSKSISSYVAWRHCPGAIRLLHRVARSKGHDAVSWYSDGLLDAR